MRNPPVAIAALLLILAPGFADAQSWSVGSHFGVTNLRSTKEGAGSSTVTGFPANTLAYQPGFRIGIANATHAHEANLDAGLLVIDEGTSTYSQLASSLGYQFTYRALRAWAPTGSVNVGVFREGSVSGTSTELSYGLGLGVRRTVSERHGAVRAELRIDRLEKDGLSGRPDLNFWGLRIGFDLWL